jgi:hypothetical protein
VARILRDAAQAEILPRFRGEISQEIRLSRSLRGLSGLGLRFEG